MQNISSLIRCSFLCGDIYLSSMEGVSVVSFCLVNLMKEQREFDEEMTNFTDVPQH